MFLRNSQTIGRLSVLAAGFVAFLLTLAPHAPAGDLRIETSVEVRQSLTDNIDLEADAEESALITELVPGASIRSTAARLNGALDVFPVVRHQSAGDEKGTVLAGDLSGFGTLEALEDLLLIDAQASISQQVLDNRAVATTANENDVITYRVSPYLRYRFGSVAEAEARYLFSQVDIRDSSDGVGNAIASDSTTNSVSFSLSNAIQSSRRLGWSVFGLASEEDRSDDDDVSRREVGTEIEYAVNRSIALILGGGYQSFDDGIAANEIDEPTWLAGVRLTPGPRTKLRATFGERDGGDNLALDFAYRFSERTKLTAGYTRVLETSQERLNRTLSDIAVGETTDDIIDQGTEFAFDPNPSPFSIDDQTTEVETLRIGLNGFRGRNAFAVNASLAREEPQPIGGTDVISTVLVSLTRELSPRSTANLDLSFERSDFDDGQLDNEYSASAGLVHRLSEGLEVGSTYSFRLQNSNVAASEFRENRILFRLKTIF